MSTILAVFLDPILPVFVIMAFGFGMGRSGATGLDEARTLNRFSMTLLIPLLIFDLVASAPLHEFDLRPMALYAVTEWVIFAGVYALTHRALGLQRGEAVILAFGAVFANNAFYGLPIALLLHGEGEILPVTMVVVLDSVLSFGGIMVILQLISRGSVSLAALGTIFVKTPVLWAIFAGLLVAAVGITLPAPVRTFLDFNGGAAAPVALFALGVVLSATTFRADAAVGVVSVVKLLVFPFAIWAANAAGVPETARQFAFASAGPTGTMALSVALLYDVDTSRVAQIMVWTSLFSLFTLAFLA